MEEMEPALEFMHTGRYTKRYFAELSDELVFHAHVWRFAKGWQMHQLKYYAHQQLLETITKIHGQESGQPTVVFEEVLRYIYNTVLLGPDSPLAELFVSEIVKVTKGRPAYFGYRISKHMTSSIENLIALKDELPGPKEQIHKLGKVIEEIENLGPMIGVAALVAVQGTQLEGRRRDAEKRFQVACSRCNENVAGPFKIAQDFTLGPCKCVSEAGEQGECIAPARTFRLQPKDRSKMSQINWAEVSTFAYI